MVVVAQLIRASDCGSEGRQFEPGQPPHIWANSVISMPNPDWEVLVKIQSRLAKKHNAYESVKKPQLVVARSVEWLLAERAIGVNIMENRGTPYITETEAWKPFSVPNK